MLLRESLWQRRFGGRRSVIGQRVNVDGVARTVVGVLGDEARFPSDGELWLPLESRYLGGTAEGPRPGLLTFGVLRDGATVSTADREVAAISDRLFTARPPDRGIRTSVVSWVQQRPEEGLAARTMMVVLILLLVVIAANVANLILARTSARTGELAVRSALGAARSRLIGQLAVETAMLGTIAAGLGLAASRAAVRWIEPRVLEKPIWLDLSLNLRTVAFVVGITLLVSVVGGVMPALKATRSNPTIALHTCGRNHTGLGLSGFGSTMMVVEMALAVVMLCSALVIARGLAGDLDQTLELPEGKILTALVASPLDAQESGAQQSGAQQSGARQSGARQSDTQGAPASEATESVATKVAVAVEQIPGVVAVGVGKTLPHQGVYTELVAVAPEGGEVETEPRRAPIGYAVPGYFEALDARVVAGRLFHQADLRAGATPVTVVNEHFVSKFLAGRNPIGRHIRMVMPGEEGAVPAWREIVGVVPDLGLNGGGREHGAGLYLPWKGDERYFSLAVRTAGDPEAWAGSLRQAVAAVDPEIRVLRLLPLEAVNQEKRSLLAGFSSSLVAMGAMVLLLSVVGLYAMISFAVTRRTREIGIRVALGATQAQVLRTVVGGAGLYLGFGGGLGIFLVLIAGAVRLLDKMFSFRLPTNQPWALPVVVGLLIAAGIVACWVPSRRALRIRPTDALRFD